MRPHQRALVGGAILAVLAGGLAPAPAANASPTHSCWSSTNDAGQPYLLECSEVASLADLDIPASVTGLRILAPERSTIAGLEGLVDSPQLTSLEINGATPEAVAAVASLTNLVKLSLSFPDGSAPSAVIRDLLTQMTRLTSLHLVGAGFRDFSWVAQLPHLENFQAADVHRISAASVGRTLAIEPVIGVDGKAIVPALPSWPLEHQATFSDLRPSSVMPLKAGSQSLLLGSNATAGSALSSSTINVDLIVDVFDTAKFGPLRTYPMVSRPNAQDYQVSVVGDRLEVPSNPYGLRDIQWMRNGVPVSGETGREYDLSSADAGKKISVTYSTHELTSWDKAIIYVPSATTTTTYDIPIPASLSDHPVAKLTGTGFMTEKLSATVNPAVFPKARKTYQWFTEDGPIAGATGSTFTPGPSHYLKRVHAQVAIPGVQDTVITLSSNEIRVDQGTLKAARPTISGTLKVGSRLTARPGTVSQKDSKVTYTWLRNGKPIFQQHRSTYTLTPADRGKRISVETQFTHKIYSSTVTRSAATNVVAPGTLRVSKKPTLTGRKIVGKTVKASAGTYSPKPEAVTYQWQRSGKNIKGATRASYKVVRADRGKKLTVKVSAVKKGYITKNTTLTAR